MVNPARLARRLVSRDLEDRRERAAGVETADERDDRRGVLLPLRLLWWRFVRITSGSASATRLVELSLLLIQLWPFSSRVDEVNASPARSSHSVSRDFLFSEEDVNPGVSVAPLELLLPMRVWICCWCNAAAFWAPRAWRSVSLSACVELLLRLWCRVRELARECDRTGGVLGTEELER